MTWTRITALTAAVTLGGLACAVGDRAARGAPEGDATEEPMTTASVTSTTPPIDLAARQVRAQTATFALG